MNPKLSVIIPIYKVEDYLERCVKSVLNQDFQDIEVILVDDGSPDCCPQICDDLAKRDERIVVVHKTNGGLSSARNAGIEIAKGDYIAFLDSDDQWAEGQLSTIMEYAIASGVNMFMFTSVSLFPDGKILKRDYGQLGGDTFEVFSAENLYKKLIQLGDLREQAGTYIIRTAFLKKYGFVFKEGILCEDTEFMFRIMRKVDNVAVTQSALLIYTEQRPGSITNTVSHKRLNDLIGVVQSSIDFYKGNNTRVKDFELAQCAYLWTIALGYCSLLIKKQSNEYCHILKNQIKYLDLSAHPKSQKVRWLYSLLGFSLTSKVLGLYLNLRSKNIIKYNQSPNE